MSNISVVEDGTVSWVPEEDAELEDKEEAERDVKDDCALGRRSSGVIVVNRVSHASSSGLKLLRRSPKPSI